MANKDTKKVVAEKPTTKPSPEKKKVVSAYVGFIKKNHKIPNKTDLLSVNITDKKIRHHFGNITKLHDFIRDNHSDVFKNILNESCFTREKFLEIKETVKSKKRFFITTAVVGHKIHEKFYKAIKSYCKHKNAELLIIPVQDPASARNNTDYTLDFRLKDEKIVFTDVALNANLNIRNIKLSAKQINPLTGLSRLGKRSGSFIFGSPKQFLESVPTNHKFPHVIMSTGAITEPEYKSTDLYFSQRTAYLASYDHVIGGLIVEIRDKKIFHVRGVQAETNTGNFVDLGDYYSASEKPSKMNAEVFSLGDLHPYQVDMTALNAWKGICKKANVQKLIIHDGFDGLSVNHHDYKKSITNAKKHYHNTISIEEELMKSIDIYKMCQKMVPDTIYFARSNHDEVLDRYLEEGRYVFDPINLRFASQMIAPMIDGHKPLQYALENLMKYDHGGQIVFLDRDEELNIAGIEWGQHGDKGPNGTRGGVAGFEKAFENCTVGHAHTPRISRGVYVNGTTSILRPGYNIGPSGWLHASTLGYPNGSRQLIISIDGLTHLED